MRKLLILGLMLALILSVGSLALAQDDMPEAWVCPEGFEGQTLRVFNWTTYVAETTIPGFEAACGVTVEYFEYGSNEEAINIIRAGSAQYDIVVPSDNTAARMINEGLALPLDLSLIPNYDNLLDAFKDPLFDPGNGYSIAYQWGTIGIGYDVNFFPDGLDSWVDFLEYEGRVAWLDDQRAVLGVMLNLLGYDPNSGAEDEIMEAARYMLDTNRADVFEIAPDTGQDLLLRGEVDAVIEYSGDIYQIMDECECEDFEYVIPVEGGVLWTDNMMIPYNSPNPTLAHAFIDYILDPVVGADLSNYTAYGTPNEAALAYIDEALLAEEGIYPSEETLNNSFIAVDVGGAEVFYSAAWNLINTEIAR